MPCLSTSPADLANFAHPYTRTTTPKRLHQRHQHCASASRRRQRRQAHPAGGCSALSAESVGPNNLRRLSVSPAVCQLVAEAILLVRTLVLMASIGGAFITLPLLFRAHIGPRCDRDVRPARLVAAPRSVSMVL